MTNTVALKKTNYFLYILCQMWSVFNITVTVVFRNDATKKCI